MACPIQSLFGFPGYGIKIFSCTFPQDAYEAFATECWKAFFSPFYPDNSSQDPQAFHESSAIPANAGQDIKEGQGSDLCGHQKGCEDSHPESPRTRHRFSRNLRASRSVPRQSARLWQRCNGFRMNSCFRMSWTNAIWNTRMIRGTTSRIAALHALGPSYSSQYQIFNLCCCCCCCCFGCMGGFDQDHVGPNASEDPLTCS